MEITHRALAVLNLSDHVPDLSKGGHAIVLAMTNSSWLANPSPPLNKVTDALNLLDDLEVKTKGKGFGTAKARNAQKRVVIGLLQQLQAFTQVIADANPADAETIIQSAGMSVKKVTKRQKNTIAARQGDLSGLVILIAMVAARTAGYVWQWSTDQKDWTTLPQVFKSRSSVAGLTPGVTYYFRYRTSSPKGETDWSQIVALLVT
jgi:hypothetical protein